MFIYTYIKYHHRDKLRKRNLETNKINKVVKLSLKTVLTQNKSKIHFESKVSCDYKMRQIPLKPLNVES